MLKLFTKDKTGIGNTEHTSRILLQNEIQDYDCNSEMLMIAAKHVTTFPLDESSSRRRQ